MDVEVEVSTFIASIVSSVFATNWLTTVIQAKILALFSADRNVFNGVSESSKHWCTNNQASTGVPILNQ
jgi:hypothetical protein